MTSELVAIIGETSWNIDSFTVRPHQESSAILVDIVVYGEVAFLIDWVFLKIMYKGTTVLPEYMAQKLNSHRYHSTENNTFIQFKVLL